MIKRILKDYYNKKVFLEDKIQACKVAINGNGSKDLVLFATTEKLSAEKKLADVESKIKWLEGEL